MEYLVRLGEEFEKMVKKFCNQEIWVLLGPE
jgi:hypothetical protein